MHRRLNPANVAAPLGAYNHGLEVAAGARWLHVSGQLGLHPDGRIGDGAGVQCELAWSNLVAVLSGAGMTVANLVKVTTSLVDRDLIPAVRSARQRHLPAPYPAMTYVVVAGLARPEYLVEIEAVAARAA